MIDITTLKHDRGLPGAVLKLMPDGSAVATKRLKCCIPKNWERSNLAEIADVVTTILMVGLICDGKYAMLGGMTRIVMKPGEIDEISIGGTRYYIFDFEPGEVVIENMTIPQDSNIGYYYYLEFTKYARLPWYCSEASLLAVYDAAKFYTGKGFGTSNQCIRVLYALVMRDPNNLDLPFRYSPDLNKGGKPKIIGINNPGQLLNSTFSRLSSGYMADNIIGGILNPDTKVTELEEVIRGLPAELRDNSNV
ncbi:virion structural protein [Aeromonas phage LAh10]|uniref:Uncharacterized protein n=1 Tax=Aeromonas phage LAh10 TaxID=2591025 RepID=A0A514A1F7_9CAUD|nr:virion structural protein [Aeromonas phage LAh10]QDH47111.1 hypothetical protein LAh10_152 [Aeromonas phage LAh10]